MTPEKSIKATRQHSPAGGSGNPRQRKLPCTLEAHVCAKVLNCTRTCTLIVTSSSPSSSPLSSPSTLQDNEAGPSGHPPVPLWPAAGQAEEDQNVTIINDMPPLTGVDLQELVNEAFPEVADVWSFLTEDDNDLVVEWARYNNK